MTIGIASELLVSNANELAEYLRENQKKSSRTIENFS